MNHLALLGCVSLACLPAEGLAQSVVTGGGTTTGGNGYPKEFSKFNPGSGIERHPPYAQPGPPPATFDTYYAAGSSVGQEAFLNDDLSCDKNDGGCTGPDGGPGNTVSYAASDLILDADQIALWESSAFGQSAAGNLIQLPSMGVGVAIPVNNPAIRKNGELTLSDNDLCGVFSGRITDFGQITDSAIPPAPGPFNVLYRTDAEGPTFWLTDHLAAVCNAGNSAIQFQATTSFASLFPGAPPANFIATADGQALASLMSCPGAPPLAIGYDTPDYTTIDPKSGATLTCTDRGAKHSMLVVAGLQVGGAAYTPTVTNIVLGLTHPLAGSDLTPPQSASAGADPTQWAPVVQTVTQGYPIIGYTSFNLAQCYADPNVAAAVILFLGDHYAGGGYQGIENRNGFATLKQLAATGYLADIKANILANKHNWNDDIEDPAACAGKSGR
jgi:ABC-type phosphate transport system substrate-binding protein